MIGVLGGTFDPIHFGHLQTALDVTESLDLQQLRFIPCGEPPHRQPPVASAAQRLAMVQVAIAGESRFVADDREIRRGGPSYMVETLESLRDEQGEESSLALILGLDAFIALDSWHRWQDLIELAHLIVMTRPGWSIQDLCRPKVQALVSAHQTDEPADCQNQAAGCVVFCPVTELAISSSRIRQQMQTAKNVQFLLPESVQEFIQQQHIYVVGNK